MCRQVFLRNSITDMTLQSADFASKSHTYCINDDSITAQNVIISLLCTARSVKVIPTSDYLFRLFT